MTNGGMSPKGRPMGVWVISTIYVLLGVWTLSVAFGSHSASSLASVDGILLLTLVATTVSAALFLFFLRRAAVALFSSALLLSLVITVSQMIRGIEGAGRGALLQWVLLVAVIVYARRLTKRGVLS